jgi:hypothetical protein
LIWRDYDILDLMFSFADLVDWFNVSSASLQKKFYLLTRFTIIDLLIVLFIWRVFYKILTYLLDDGPYVIDWFGRVSIRYSLLYDLIRDWLTVSKLGSDWLYQKSPSLWFTVSLLVLWSHLWLVDFESLALIGCFNNNPVLWLVCAGLEPTA